MLTQIQISKLAWFNAFFIEADHSTLAGESHDFIKVSCHLLPQGLRRMLRKASKGAFMSDPLLEWVKVLGPLVFSWPVAIFILAALFRDLIRKLANRLIASSDAKAEFGPLKVQLGSIAKDSQDVLERLNKLLELSARHKIFTNEVLTGQLAHRFTPEQIQQMNEQADEIKSLLAIK